MRRNVKKKNSSDGQVFSNKINFSAVHVLLSLVGCGGAPRKWEIKKRGTDDSTILFYDGASL